MSVLPQGSAALSAGVEFRRQPSRTWYIDPDTNRIHGEADGLASVKQAAEIILNTNRFQWQIYRPYSGVELTGLIGRDAGYVAAELQRRVLDALTMDDRISGVSDFSYTLEGDTIRAEMTLNTVYGDTELAVELEL